MTARLQGALEARRILERHGELSTHLLEPPVSESWRRCLAAGMDPRRIPRLAVLEHPELRRHGDECAVVAGLARIEMEALYHQIAGSNYLIAFGDRDGVVIDRIADPAFASSAAGRQITPGSVWRESLAGTNALGTASATAAGLIVHGAEHFYSCFDGITCAAAPILHYDGRLAGVLDASSFCDAYPAHTLVLVRMAALNVANGLFRHEMQGHHVLELHPRSEFVGSIAAGLIAVDQDGVLRGINEQAHGLMPGIRIDPGMAFGQVFLEPFDAVLARLHNRRQTSVSDPLERSYVIAAHGPGVPGPLRLPGMPPVAVSAQCPDSDGPHQRPASSARSAGGSRSGSAPAVSGEAELVCGDPAVRECLRLAEAAARLPAPILITGETGTGKEMLARHAHRASGRSGVLVAVNCAAMPAELFEAELFGYAGGAFTGARREGHGGLIAEADGGTLLLDEIADLPLPMQAALLRFLDDYQVRPVGAREVRVVDTLVVAATNSDLRQAVAERRFRADLLYRLDTVQVRLPALRERSDLAELAAALLAGIDRRARLDPSVLAPLAAHDWPGNIRELRAVLTRARLLAGNQPITAAHLRLAPPPGNRGMAEQAPGGATGQRASAASGSLRSINGELVRATLAELDGNVSATAARLSISRNTVYRYLRETEHA